MKSNYKEHTINIGYSDISTLTLWSINRNEDLKVQLIHTGWDGQYRMHILYDDVALPEYYNHILHCNGWLKIGDDAQVTFDSNHYALDGVQISTFFNTIESYDLYQARGTLALVLHKRNA